MNHSVVGGTAGGRLRAMLALMRPGQWVKNGLVLAPLIFSGKFLETAALERALMATILFCLVSSAAYIVNDIHDLAWDRRHPLKSKTRPLASGDVPASSAYVLLAVLYASLLPGWWLLPRVVPVLIAYLVLNLGYTFFLKQQPIVDLFTIAIGYVLRVYAGAFALAVHVSDWMFVTTLCLALYLAASKRRQELVCGGLDTRVVLQHYSVPLLDRYAEMAATGALVFYSIFVLTSRPQLAPTVPLVLFGLFRYRYVVEELGKGESPTDALLTDWQLMLTVALWAMACVWALWPS